MSFLLFIFPKCWILHEFSFFLLRFLISWNWKWHEFYWFLIWFQIQLLRLKPSWISFLFNVLLDILKLNPSWISFLFIALLESYPETESDMNFYQNTCCFKMAEFTSLHIQSFTVLNLSSSLIGLHQWSYNSSVQHILQYLYIWYKYMV